jgi:two-component system cell cycle response regulator
MPERILVVDDEAVNREFQEAILIDAGYEVVVASDGASALAEIQAHPPDLILLDLLMPGMHGLEVCQRLKQEMATARIPVIVVTAVGQITAKEAALTSGADDFVTKPVQPADLRVRVQAMLKVRQIRQELDRTLAYLHELESERRAQRRRALAQAGALPLPERSDGPTRIPILLVDDEALTREFYGDLLTEHGFSVLAASSGKEALSLFASTPVETVVLDIVMPEVSGLEVLEMLHWQDPDLPVIMLTGHATSQNAMAALKLGAFDFIVKGLDPTLVVMAIHRAVRHRRKALEQREESVRLQARIQELEAERKSSHQQA